jgi:hypothetical protein
MFQTPSSEILTNSFQEFQPTIDSFSGSYQGYKDSNCLPPEKLVAQLGNDGTCLFSDHPNRDVQIFGAYKSWPLGSYSPIFVCWIWVKIAIHPILFF